jgi:mRNA interferase RelE/StbE
MIIKFDKTFDREIEKLKNRRLQNSIVDALKEIERAGIIQEVKNLKKLKGFKNCYRIRVGDYRIGIFYEGKDVEVIRFGHRRDFYRYFP